jgi:hypothetical protein
LLARMWLTLRNKTIAYYMRSYETSGGRHESSITDYRS